MSSPTPVTVPESSTVATEGPQQGQVTVRLAKPVVGTPAVVVCDASRAISMLVKRTSIPFTLAVSASSMRMGAPKMACTRPPQHAVRMQRGSDGFSQDDETRVTRLEAAWQVEDEAEGSVLIDRAGVDEDVGGADEHGDERPGFPTGAGVVGRTSAGAGEEALLRERAKTFATRSPEVRKQVTVAIACADGYAEIAGGDGEALHLAGAEKASAAEHVRHAEAAGIGEGGCWWRRRSGRGSCRRRCWRWWRRCFRG